MARGRSDRHVPEIGGYPLLKTIPARKARVFLANRINKKRRPDFGFKDILQTENCLLILSHFLRGHCDI